MRNQGGRMTKEIKDIIAAYKEAQKHGRQTALATVVHVEGSSYRRPGARMLIEDNGKLTGAISGGCLEGDALRKALLAIQEGQNKLVTYDTSQEDEVQFGVQLGCNGIVHILFEPILPNQAYNPITWLESFMQQRRNVVLTTLFYLNSPFSNQPGTCLFFDGDSVETIIEDNIASQLKKDAEAVIQNRSSIIKEYSEQGLTAFIELLQPAVSLVIVGAGNDALPVVDMAEILGWETTIVDGRSTHANQQRFSKANKIIVAKPPEAIKQITIDEWTVIVLMTHNYNYDLAMMRLLMNQQCKYIGVLGPRKRLDRLLGELEEQGVSLNDDQKGRLFGPIGLDIGAEAAEEIALSIIAEIKAVLSNREGSSLRNRLDEIHPRDEVRTNQAITQRVK